MTPAELDRFRDLSMARMKADGVPVALIAKHFKCSRVTVWRATQAIPPEAIRSALTTDPEGVAPPCPTSP